MFKPKNTEKYSKKKKKKKKKKIISLLLPFEVSQVLLFICFPLRFRSILPSLVSHVDNLAMSEMILFYR